jgi:hypothetical protein
MSIEGKHRAQFARCGLFVCFDVDFSRNEIEFIFYCICLPAKEFCRETQNSLVCDVA